VAGVNEATHVAGALETLRDQLEVTRLTLGVPGLSEAIRTRDELVGQIDDHLLPRLRSLESPLLVVIGGSTGAGKSTIVNSLVGNDVTATGVVRPTTRVPILVCNPSDASWFEDDRILPGLARVTGASSSGDSVLNVVLDEDVPSGMALLDAPDIDSVVSSNRELAAKLLAAADLWLFVTTAARYADAVPWEFLRTAATRSTAIAILLNRIPPEAQREVPEHLSEMLRAHDLGDAPLFPIREVDLAGGFIPDADLAPLRSWLHDLSADAQARTDLIRRTLHGALVSIPARIAGIASTVESEIAAARELRETVDRSYAAALREVEGSFQSGTLLRSEVLARWHEFLGTGDLMRTIEARIGWVRDRIRDAFTGRPAPPEEVQVALNDSIALIVTAGAERAAQRSFDSWNATSAGEAMLPGSASSLEHASSGLRAQASEHIREWQRRVLELVAAEGAEKRTTGRILSIGVNGIGSALMVALFAQTGGLTGGEIAIAGGTAALSHKVLEALFGDQAVRDLTTKARSELMNRIEELLAVEAGRYHQILAERAPGERDAAELTDAARAVQAALD
jgi:hypothetical protein